MRFLTAVFVEIVPVNHTGLSRLEWCVEELGKWDCRTKACFGQGRSRWAFVCAVWCNYI